MLSCLLSLCLYSTHGQSAFECGFSTNADMVADNQSDHSLMVLRMVQDHIL